MKKVHLGHLGCSFRFGTRGEVHATRCKVPHHSLADTTIPFIPYGSRIHQHLFSDVLVQFKY